MTLSLSLRNVLNGSNNYQKTAPTRVVGAYSNLVYEPS